MKSFVYIVAIVVTVSAIAFTSISVYKHFNSKSKPAETIVQYVKDKYSIDSITAERDNWKTQFYYSQERINNLATDRRRIQNETKEIILYADSLEREIAFKNDTDCIKAITAKNIVIQHKDSIITSLDAEAREYSQTIFLAQTTIQKDSLIISKQAQTINNLSCAYEWKIKHKFWAWIFGWKCK